MCAGEPLELWVGAGLPSPIIGSSPLAARYMSDDATRCDRGSYTGVLQATYATRRAGICEFVSRGPPGGTEVPAARRGLLFCVYLFPHDHAVVCNSPRTQRYMTDVRVHCAGRHVSGALWFR